MYVFDKSNLKPAWKLTAKKITEIHYPEWKFETAQFPMSLLLPYIDRLNTW